jgi:hypothetical protein
MWGKGDASLCFAPIMRNSGLSVCTAQAGDSPPGAGLAIAECGIMQKGGVEFVRRRRRACRQAADDSR